MRAVGFVREDLSDDVPETMRELRAVAASHHLLELRVWVIADPAVAFALAADADVVLVPTEAHIRGWMDAVRVSADVYTVDPPRCWPRGGGPARRLVSARKPSSAAR
ncbi:hypothetical protein FEK31_15620 [Nocardia cyriacigeorgica]|nr:hypothetical protein FEK31_15620 [Nocardia cyriacigeorgica]VFA98934.1 Uncharacterised protein [Nocardia cyriacigeorgica]